MLNSTPVRTGMFGLLNCGVALSALLIGGAAFAQEPAPPAPAADQRAESTDADGGDEDEIVVTGTLIRGSAPTGSDLITVGEQEIEATGATTTGQLLANIPQLGAFGFRPIIVGGMSTQLTVNRVNLRNLPATGGGGATLVLMDGHRLPGMGIRQTIPDPDVIPPATIQRVEIVPDGGSSIYGADAVGGVVNFITRKRFDGFEVEGRYGFADNYQSLDGSITAGKEWDGASAYVSYNYAWHDALYGRDRDFAQRVDWPTGLPFDLTCQPGNIRISSRIYALPGLTLGAGNRCDTSDNATIYPSEERHSVLAGLNVDNGGPVTLDVRAYYTERRIRGSAGALVATGGITPSSPFYRSVGGADAAADQVVLFDFSPILGNESRHRSDLTAYGFAAEIAAQIGGGWQLRFLANWGRGINEVSNDRLNDNALSTLVGSGQFDPYNLLNPANQPLLSSVVDFRDYGLGKNELVNSRVVLDGSLFTLPGGDVRVAVGAEYLYEALEIEIAQVVAASAVDTVPRRRANRNTEALFGEIQVPIIGEGNRGPLGYALNLSASGRYDHYSDFGGTFNPNFGIRYQPVDWITLRGKWGKSFQAPSLSDSSRAEAITLFPFPFILFQSPIPGQAPLPGEFAQIFIGGGGATLKPQKATTWSLGAEISPPVIPGLTLEASYYNVEFTDLIGIPPVFNPLVFFGQFTDFYVLHPTVAQINAFVSQIPGAALPSFFTASEGRVYSIADGRKANFAAVKTSGLDFAARYDRRTGFGSIYARVSGNYLLTFDQQAITGQPFADLVKTNPRLRLAATAGATIGGLRAEATFNHTGGYEIGPTPANLMQTRVGAFNVVDLFFEYEVGGQGVFEDLAFTLNIDNLLNQDPPLFRGSADLRDGFANGFTVGRFFQFGVRKKF